jgi:DUF4097 and DUF4098 domain-containing protein YvlB
MNHSLAPLLRLRPLALLAAGALCAALPARAETDGSIRKTFDVTPGGKLVVEVAGSKVEVEGTTGSQVVVEYTRVVSADSPEAEARILKEREVTLAQSGNTVSLVEQRPASGSNHSGSFWDLITGRDRGFRSKFHVLIKVPSQFNVDLRTSGGGIELANVSGQIDARTSGGSLVFREITGPVEGRTSGGSIRVEHYQGDMNLSTSGGSITAEDGKGRLNLKTSGGGITISGASGNVSASTSGGSIRLALTTTPDGENRLSTSGGSITVSVPAGSPVDIDAATSGGSVSTDLAVTSTTTKERNRFVGSLNGGGPLLHLRTSGGSIRISADTPAKAAAARR